MNVTSSSLKSFGVQTVLDSAKRHPVLYFCGLSASLCVYWELKASRENHHILLSTLANTSRVTDQVASELREILKATDVKFAIQMKQRDDLMRKLQLQNVEQTKSVARLQAALRLCVRDPREVPQLIANAELSEASVEASVE